MTERDAFEPWPQPEPAEILREFGPFPGVSRVNGVSYDGRSVWLAVGEALHAISPETGERRRTLEVPAQAGTAFDGRHLYQLADGVIQKIDPETGQVIQRVPAPAENLSGMTWSEGFLWIGEYSARKIHKVDPETGAILRSIESKRFVTGVTWANGELWHGTMEDGRSELCQVDPESGAVRRRLVLEPEALVSGLESDGRDVFYAGGASSGTVRAIRRPRSR